ncbi:calmodulin-lysine N-methyltransferase isoform X2 [Humulus lupulus]|uniref:calmodulin-lysine N-methyltransferase isoform X2 n=1 Tax=Humulus lupulus TaxID=3486 RepID=UPI002B40E9A8|nr:calmodulin-lysine N-methyltransferase isoform X2 [Humulus lupulus]
MAMPSYVPSDQASRREIVQTQTMENASHINNNNKTSSLRWTLLRQALLRRTPPQPSAAEGQSESTIKRISRKAMHGFNLIPYQLVNNDSDAILNRQNNSRDATLCYTLPIDGAPKLFLTQRVNNVADISDLEFCNKHDIDNTGLVCQWPSEDVLAYFCLSHADLFRSKRVIELGSGYGLAGLVIAAVTEASEIIITDGNPQVVNYIEHNIDANSRAFGATKVKSMALHWNQDEISNISYSFDLIVASDCTFFKECHKGLAQVVKNLLRKVGPCEAIFFSPKRGDSLDKFLDEIKENGLHFSITEDYDAEIWKRHQSFMNEDHDTWPSYEKDHCYPLLELHCTDSILVLVFGGSHTLKCTALSSKSSNVSK